MELISIPSNSDSGSMCAQNSSLPVQCGETSACRILLRDKDRFLGGVKGEGGKFYAHSSKKENLN